MTHSAKVVDYEKFIKGLKVIILTGVTSNMLSSSQRNSGSHWLVLKRELVLDFKLVTCNSE